MRRALTKRRKSDVEVRGAKRSEEKRGIGKYEMRTKEREMG